MSDWEKVYIECDEPGEFGFNCPDCKEEFAIVSAGLNMAKLFLKYQNHQRVCEG